jgi:Fur family transcriptional regulator, ferric uptake regulator
VKTENHYQFIESGSGLLQALGEAGYSNTAARRAVIAALVTAHEHVSPAQLLAAGRTYHAALGQVTVYRTLEVLVSLGLVRKLHTAEGCHSYALVTHVHGHHVMCQRCHEVVEFDGCDVGRVVADVERQTGYHVSEHWLELFGLCPACQQAEVGAANVA